MLTFFYTRLFTSFRYLNTLVWLENTDPATRQESRLFFYLHSSHHLLFLSIFKFFEFLRFKFCTYLSRLKQDARYDMRYTAFHAFTSDLWQIWQVSFISFFSCLVFSQEWQISYQRNWLNSATWNSLPNIFSDKNFCLSTELCFIHPTLIWSRLRVLIKWIIYCISILKSNKVINCDE